MILYREKTETLTTVVTDYQIKEMARYTVDIYHLDSTSSFARVKECFEKITFNDDIRLANNYQALLNSIFHEVLKLTYPNLPEDVYDSLAQLRRD